MCVKFEYKHAYLTSIHPEMRYVAAYLLATLGGKNSPSKNDIQNILDSVGLDVDDEKLSKVGTLHVI